jgi:hypothetical protein
MSKIKIIQGTNLKKKGKEIRRHPDNNGRRTLSFLMFCFTGHTGITDCVRVNLFSGFALHFRDTTVKFFCI